MSRHLPVVAAVLLTMALPGRAAADDRMGDTAHLYLTNAVERAIARHPSIGIAQARSEEAGASVREAFASWLPALQLGATAMRYEKPMLVYPLHGLDPRLLATQLPVFDNTLVQAGLTLDFTLFDASRGARIRRTRYQSRAMEANLDGAQQALVGRVIVTYLSVLTKREILSAHDQRLAALESERSRVRQLRDVGRAADVEILRVEAVLSGAQADRVHLAAALDQAESDLGRLIEMPSEEIHRARLVPVTPTDSTTEIRDSVFSLALSSSPGILQARRQLDATQAGRTAARGALWPVLRATGSILDRGASESAHKAEWNAGVVLSYPIFAGGALQNAVARADAVNHAATEQLRLASLQLAEDVDRVLSGLAESRARTASLAVAVERFTEVARIEKLSLEAGARTQTDYLRAEADLLAARASLAEARHAEIAARVEMARITGQLSTNWIAQSLENQQ